MWRENIKRIVPFAFGKGHCYAVGEYGFCIVNSVNGNHYIRFRSNSFTQQKINEDEYLFTDKTSNSQYSCCMDADSSDPDETFKEFEIVTTTIEIKEKYDHILTALKKLLLASTQMNNRIIFY